MNLDEYLIQLVEPNSAEGPAFASVPSVPALEKTKAECERLRLLAAQVVSATSDEKQRFAELLERAEKVRSEIEGDNEQK